MTEERLLTKAELLDEIDDAIRTARRARWAATAEAHRWQRKASEALEQLEAFTWERKILESYRPF